MKEDGGSIINQPTYQAVTCTNVCCTHRQTYTNPPLLISSTSTRSNCPGWCEGVSSSTPAPVRPCRYHHHHCVGGWRLAVVGRHTWGLMRGLLMDAAVSVGRSVGRMDHPQTNKTKKLGMFCARTWRHLSQPKHRHSGMWPQRQPLVWQASPISHIWVGLLVFGGVFGARVCVGGGLSVDGDWRVLVGRQPAPCKP